MTTLTLDQFHDLNDPTRSAVVDWLRDNDLSRVIVVAAHRFKTNGDGNPYVSGGRVASETVIKTAVRPSPLDAPHLYTLDGSWRGTP